uniref:Uncharacterized protein n=1 Tax=Arundo donax TaxID=35708 RepID=A0A0A9FR41_ARUDO
MLKVFIFIYKYKFKDSGICTYTFLYQICNFNV